MNYYELIFTAATFGAGIGLGLALAHKHGIVGFISGFAIALAGSMALLMIVRVLARPTRNKCQMKNDRHKP